MKQNPNELLEQGKAEFLAGNLETAKAALLRVAALQPGEARVHALLASVAQRLGDLTGAESHMRRAVEAQPLTPAIQDRLLAVQLALRGASALLDTYRREASEQPTDFGANYRLAALLLRMNRVEESIPWLRTALALAPGTYRIEMMLAGALFELGKYQDVLAVIRDVQIRGGDNAELHELAGRVMLRFRKPEEAVLAYRRALDRNADEQRNHVGLSAALYQASRLEDAQQVTGDFLRRFNAFTQPAKRRPEARVLVVSAVGPVPCFRTPVLGPKRMFINGNSLAEVPGDRHTYHFTLIEHPDLLAGARTLGPIDVIFNNVAGAEHSISANCGPKIRELAEGLGVPVINEPQAVERTTRIENARIIPANTDIIYPRTAPFDLTAGEIGDIAGRIAETIPFPILIRRPHTNKDKFAALATDKAGLAEALGKYRAAGVAEIYAIEFITQEFRPGIYRKIRCAIIDRVVFPVRVDFSTHWNVRRQPEDSAVSLANRDLMDDEHAFIRDPAAYLGDKNMARLEALGRLHDLDYIGVDFNIIGDGDMVIFEANAAMNCIERRHVAEFPYFADYWERVLVAYEDMIARKAGKR